MQAMQENRVQSPGLGKSLEEGIATLCVILAWIIPWTGSPVRLRSTGLQRVGHDSSDLPCMHTRGHTVGSSMTQPSLALEFMLREKQSYKDDRQVEILLNP